MPDDFERCKAIGGEFEEEVASKLRALGYTVYRNLYIPYRPMSNAYTEVDIVGINATHIVTVECKCMSGVLRGGQYDKTWILSTSADQEVANPFRQSYSHSRAIRDNLGLTAVDLIVLSNSVVYQGPSHPKVCHFAYFDERFAAAVQAIPPQSVYSEQLLTMLHEWQNPPDTVKQKHILGVNRAKNGEVPAQALEGYSMPYYCVMIGPYFYAYKDDKGHHWAVEKLEEAALYKDICAAYDLLEELPQGVVCTLELGGIEDVADLPDEMDELTADEYAAEVGARPW